MNRRTFLKSAGGVAVTAGLAGCLFNGTAESKLRITDLGVVKKHESAATYVTVENITSEKQYPRAALAAYDPDGVRVSDWESVDGDALLAGEQRSLFVVYDAESVGWFNSNNLGQVVQTHGACVRVLDDNLDPAGPILGEEALGKTFSEAKSDAQ